ncbi:hypothetical protein JK211_16540 [Tatumella sp. JGM130]|uniref:hypothetical protein n=1 Tax=Tatumella sp. JGM130 TaxID=2799797 RepID=UPI001BB0C8EA|nr:hypothetical protein [Tatumella sp. JGM130]MBS0895601.1 hypothetical protein [Tatumella sp. JGM130]
MITEQRRQELISHGNELKERIEDFGHKSDFELMTLQLVEIALASLTAEPTYSRYRLTPKGSNPETEPSSWFPGDGKAFGKSHDVEVNYLFTAPPVPVIKFPEYQKLLDHPVVKSRWNQCIDEVKRLNGLGE